MLITFLDRLHVSEINYIILQNDHLDAVLASQSLLVSIMVSSHATVSDCHFWSNLKWLFPGGGLSVFQIWWWFDGWQWWMIRSIRYNVVLMADTIKSFGIYPPILCSILQFTTSTRCLYRLEQLDGKQSKAQIVDGGEFTFMTVLYMMISLYFHIYGSSWSVASGAKIKVYCKYCFVEDWNQLLSDECRAVKQGTIPEVRSDAVLERIC